MVDECSREVVDVSSVVVDLEASRSVVFVFD